MKKYLLFLLTILSISLAGCSVDDDYCGNGFYKSDQLPPKGNFHPDNFRVMGLDHNNFTVIKSEREFQDRVRGAQFYRNEINFRDYELIIGEALVDRHNNIIDIVTMYKESCNSRGDNLLEVEFFVNKGLNNSIMTYHTIVPRTRSDYYAVRTSVRYK
ncbi:hypothetical protein HX049_03395 [Myroides odoratimimus]|uniref:hypothetical protein n=1 Tax=Myroides odoratimimus TaxID=76832 RepID=UPI0025785D13|nr:hypothetical protein [Myroides odoratimimus]MDM1396224.1 hypothetical protein [Myroides odoratimimus]